MMDGFKTLVQICQNNPIFFFPEINMKTLLEALSPIKFPQLIREDIPIEKEVYRKAFKAIGIVESWHDTSNGEIYIWDDKESRLWFFGQKEAFVSYFTFEYGKPFMFIKESLLVTRKGNSFDWNVLAKHLMMSLQYPIPASGELLPADGPYPAILGELSKKKLLPKGSEKFARHLWDQRVMEKLGFRQPTLSRYDVLLVLVEATSNYNFSTISKLHPILWSMVAVPGLLTQTNEEKLDQKKDGIQEVQSDFIENDKAGYNSGPLDPPIWPPSNIYHESPQEAAPAISQEKQGE